QNYSTDTTELTILTLRHKKEEVQFVTFRSSTSNNNYPEFTEIGHQHQSLKLNVANGLPNSSPLIKITIGTVINVKTFGLMEEIAQYR
uniref:Uncharacterized protein n=1 Tax=Strigamia maritima TaxID=126957 RepID=T1IKM2_STRMM